MVFGATGELNTVLHLSLVKNGHMAVNATPPPPCFQVLTQDTLRLHLCRLIDHPIPHPAPLRDWSMAEIRGEVEPIDVMQQG